MEWLAGLFDWFQQLFQSASWVAVLAAFVWGIFSILLSPCHLSAIPLAIGYINGSGKLKPSKAFLLSLVFSVGILITLAVIGLITGLLGRMLGDIGKIGTIIVGVIFVLMGTLLLDILPLPQIHFFNPDVKNKGYVGALVLGLTFGLGLGPCSFGFMMPLLLIVFQSAQSNITYSVLLLSSFALGHIVLIVGAGVFINWVQKLLNWNEKSGGLIWFKRVCGVCVILAGTLIILQRLGFGL